MSNSISTIASLPFSAAAWTGSEWIHSVLSWYILMSISVRPRVAATMECTSSLPLIVQYLALSEPVILLSDFQKRTLRMTFRVLYFSNQIAWAIFNFGPTKPVSNRELDRTNQTATYDPFEAFGDSLAIKGMQLERNTHRRGGRDWLTPCRFVRAFSPLTARFPLVRRS